MLALLLSDWAGLLAGLLLVFALFGLILVPYLVKINRDGKRELGPLRRLHQGGQVSSGPATPAGAGDNNPGRVGDPAPGMPDGQADPYGARAQRDAPPVRS